MKLLVISGSRNPQGQTGRAVAALVEGAAAARCSCETIFLPTLAIERCRQCDEDGWGVCRDGERCVIEDGLADIVDKIRAADVIVFATPVYFRDLSESLRGFLDRLRRVCVHGGKRDRIQGKTAVGICVAGGGGGGAPHCAFRLEEILATCGFDVVDMIPVRRQNLAVKCRTLRVVGEWLATGPTSG